MAIWKKGKPYKHADKLAIMNIGTQNPVAYVGKRLRS